MKNILFLVLLTFSCLASGQRSGKEFTIVFYNVENLFDTEDELLKEDEEFTPVSAKGWNQEKYEKKLENIGRVLSSIKSSGLPEIIGLCEIENRKVLDDLAGSKSLRKGNYSIVHSDSPDKRGIDVAFLYNPENFTVRGYHTIPVIFPFDSTETTRDILYVTGTDQEGETLHFFVNHWTSRTGDSGESEFKRIFAAVALRKEIDALMNSDPKAKIVIMGNLNDEPTNRSIYEMLLSNNKRKNFSYRELYNLMYDMHNTTGTGTYYNQGRWTMLDQIIISRPLLSDRSGLHTDYEGGKILKEEWMLNQDKESGEFIPNPTYIVTEYKGGFSDHLPVYVTLVKE
ncbi:MAG: hypothetical protein AMS27_04355 [Bacteroides sp. SM23_62_1]|nr:MAG: hypothetical protein AMS27_04355 [Bacteroides sp. SM23_62_1]